MDNGEHKGLSSESTTIGVPSTLGMEILKPYELRIPATQADEMESMGGGSELIVLGSGSSTGVPSPLCLINPTDPPCHVCHMAMKGPHELNRNYRCNPSLLICYMHDDGQRRYIQIDAGKDFKEQVLRWFVPYKIPRLDALILTHEHADAMLGLDNVRGVQPFNVKNDIPPMPVFVTQHTMDSAKAKFPYLASKKRRGGEELRRVAQFDWRIIEASIDYRFEAAGLTFTPLPVWHGEDYISLGFLFGEKTRIAYISDVSRFPTETEQVISKEHGGQVDLLFVDTNGVGLPGGMTHLAAIAKYGAGQVDLLFLDSLYKVLEVLPISVCLLQQGLNLLLQVDYCSAFGTSRICFSSFSGMNSLLLIIPLRQNCSENASQHTFDVPRESGCYQEVAAKTCFLVGMTHEFEHELDTRILAEWSSREGIPVHLAYDGLRIPVEL